MDIEQKFEELKRKIEKALLQRGGIPNEVMELIDQIKQALLEKNNELGLHYSSIRTYIETQFDIFKSFSKKDGKDRQNKKIEQAIYDLMAIKQSEKNRIGNQILEERKKQDNIEASRMTDKILGHLEEHYLADIYSHERRILRSREFDEGKIDDIVYEVKAYIQRLLVNKYESQMIDLFNIDNEQIRIIEEEVIGELEDFKRKNSRTTKEGFKEELTRCAPTAQEQRRFSNKIKEDEEKSRDKKNSLPDNILE